MAVGDGSSILDYMPLTGPYRAFTGDGGDGDAGTSSCLPTDGEIAFAQENAPLCDGTNHENAANYVPPFMHGEDACNVCGYEGTPVGASCSVCNIGHGIST